MAKNKKQVSNKQKRSKKIKEWVASAGKVIGVLATIAGTIYLAIANSDDEETDYDEFDSLSYGDDSDRSSNVGNIAANECWDEDDVVWFCDGCDAELNRQRGFNTYSGTWRCKKCGYSNDVTENNILSEEEAEFQASLQTDCPCCGGHMCIGTGYAKTTYVCEDCGKEAWYNDYGLLIFED